MTFCRGLPQRRRRITKQRKVVEGGTRVGFSAAGTDEDLGTKSGSALRGWSRDFQSFHSGASVSNRDRTQLVGCICRDPRGASTTDTAPTPTFSIRGFASTDGEELLDEGCDQAARTRGGWREDGRSQTAACLAFQPFPLHPRQSRAAKHVSRCRLENPLAQRRLFHDAHVASNHRAQHTSRVLAVYAFHLPSLPFLGPP